MGGAVWVVMLILPLKTMSEIIFRNEGSEEISFIKIKSIILERLEPIEIDIKSSNSGIEFVIREGTVSLEYEADRPDDTLSSKIHSLVFTGKGFES